MENNIDKKIKYGTIKPYKVYAFMASQNNENAPVVTVLENTIGDLVWTYVEAGLYRGTYPQETPTNIFPMEKTACPQSNTICWSLSDGGAFQYVLRVLGSNSNYVEVYTKDPADDSFVNNALTVKPIEIRVYN
jgi:hypothetical protein